MAEVEVDEMLRLVGYIRSKVTSNNAMPCGVVFLVELFLDVGSDVLLDVVFLKSLKSRKLRFKLMRVLSSIVSSK